MFSFKKSFVFVFIILLVFGYMVFSDEVNTRYTEFYFSSGGQSYNHLLVNLTGGETGNVTIYLENKSDSIFNGKFSFVDGDIVQHGSTGVRVCKSENEKNVFGQYVKIDSETFSIQSNYNIIKPLDLIFPPWYSGLYYGCIVYYPILTENDGYLNTSARKAIFLDVNVSSVSNIFNLKIYPSDRSNSLKKGNYGNLFFYNIFDTGTILFNEEIQTDADGNGMFLANIPNGEYFVVYKGQSHLASYISGFVFTGNNNFLFDFTTGDNLFGTKEYSLSLNDGYSYQIAGDLKNSIGIYDGKINVNDITMLVSDQCSYNSAIIDQYHPCNLNGDNMVNMADIGVIITNIGKEGPYLQGYEIFGGM